MTANNSNWEFKKIYLSPEQKLQKSLFGEDDIEIDNTESISNYIKYYIK